MSRLGVNSYSSTCTYYFKHIKLTDLMKAIGSFMSWARLPTKGSGLGPGGLRLLEELNLKISSRSRENRPPSRAKPTDVQSKYLSTDSILREVQERTDAHSFIQ